MLGFKFYPEQKRKASASRPKTCLATWPVSTFLNSNSQKTAAFPAVVKAFFSKESSILHFNMQFLFINPCHGCLNHPSNPAQHCILYRNEQERHGDGYLTKLVLMRHKFEVSFKKHMQLLSFPSSHNQKQPPPPLQIKGHSKYRFLCNVEQESVNN